MANYLYNIPLFIQVFLAIIAYASNTGGKMDNLVGQLIIVIAAVIIVPEMFKKLKISGSTVMLGVFIAVAAYIFFSKGGVQTVIASIMGR